MSTLSNTSQASSSSSALLIGPSPTAFSHELHAQPSSASSSPWSSPDYGPIEQETEPPPAIPGLPASAIAEIRAVFAPPVGVSGLPIMRINPAWSSPPVKADAGSSKK